MEGNRFDLSACEFRAAMILRYGCISVDLPAQCDADGKRDLKLGQSQC